MILLDITKRSKYSIAAAKDGDHMDRCLALIHLVQCYQRQDKFELGLKRCTELEKAILAVRQNQPSSNSRIDVIVAGMRKDLEDLKRAHVSKASELDTALPALS